jgi:uncharacterized protein (TIGR02117 family)
MLRRIALLCASIASLLVLYMLAAVAGGMTAGPRHATPVATPTQSIALVIGPAHTDLLLPLTPQTRTAFAFAGLDGVPVSNPGAEWLVIGWGARGVYTTMGTWGDVSMPALWRGATGDDAVIRMDVLGPIDTSVGIDMIAVTDAQMAALLGAILASLSRNADGQPRALPEAGFTATDQYYAATGTFHIARTCNVWMSETLRAAGIPFGIWTPTPYAMRLSLWRFHPAP